MVATEEAGGKVQVEPMGIASFLITSEEKRMVEDRKVNQIQRSKQANVNMTQHDFSVPSTTLKIWGSLWKD
eukprot:scaffold248533_cov91-Cyclotella_meneghiniana.AAC.1